MVTGRPPAGSDPEDEEEEGDDDGRLQLTTLHGWRQFVTDLPAVPQLLAESVWSDLDTDKRMAYDDDRVEHHSRLAVVETPAIRDVISTGRRLAQMNRSEEHT